MSHFQASISVPKSRYHTSSKSVQRWPENLLPIYPTVPLSSSSFLIFSQPSSKNRTGASAGSRTRIDGFGDRYTIHCATPAKRGPDVLDSTVGVQGFFASHENETPGMPVSPDAGGFTLAHHPSLRELLARSKIATTCLFL